MFLSNWFVIYLVCLVCFYLLQIAFPFMAVPPSSAALWMRYSLCPVHFVYCRLVKGMNCTHQDR